MIILPEYIIGERRERAKWVGEATFDADGKRV